MNSKKNIPWYKYFLFRWFSGGCPLTIAIILIRAFQNNAEPMSSWTALSWVWMTMPIWLPTIICTIIFAIWFGLWLWANTHKY